VHLNNLNAPVLNVLKLNFKKSLKIIELADGGGWYYEVLLADFVWRFPISVYNMLEIIRHILLLCNITDILSARMLSRSRPSIDNNVQRALVYKNNYSRSGYTLHLTNRGHSVGQMAGITDKIFNSHKRKNMDTVEKYHKHKKKHRKGIQLNDKSTITKNKIFDLIVKHDYR